MTDTIDAVLRDQAARHDAKPTVVDPGTRITYAELDAATLELGAAFIASGIGKGARVGLIMPNGVEWARIALALMRIGAVLVPLSTLLHRRELTAQLRTASVQHLIAVEEFRGHRYLDALDRSAARAAHGAGPPTQAAALHEQSERPGCRGDVARRARRRSAGDHVHLGQQRSAEGRPAFPRQCASAAVRSGLAARCIDADTRLYLPMPFFWVGGFGGGLLSALIAGATLVTEPVPQPDSTLELLAASG